MTPRSEKAIHSCNAEVIERLQAEVESLRGEKAGLIELCAAKIKGPLNALEAITKLESENARYRQALEKIADDREFSHDLNGNFVRKVWYAEEAKRTLSSVKPERGEG